MKGVSLPAVKAEARKVGGLLKLYELLAEGTPVTFDLCEGTPGRQRLALGEFSCCVYLSASTSYKVSNILENNRPKKSEIPSRLVFQEKDNHQVTQFKSRMVNIVRFIIMQAYYLTGLTGLSSNWRRLYDAHDEVFECDFDAMQEMKENIEEEERKESWEEDEETEAGRDDDESWKSDSEGEDIERLWERDADRYQMYNSDSEDEEEDSF